MALRRIQHCCFGRALPDWGLDRPRLRERVQLAEMGVIMQVPQDAVLLRIFFGEDEKAGHLPLYEAIVLKAREMRLAGATVLRGPMGFGHSSRIHTTKILRLSQDLPIVVEIVDSEEKINGFLAVLNGMIGSGLVTLEKVKVLQYGKEAKA